MATGGAPVTRVAGRGMPLAGRLRTVRVPEDHVGQEAYREAVGERIRLARAALLITQDALADAAGVHRNFLGGIERGTVGLDAYRLSRIAAALRLPVATLLNGDGFDHWIRCR